MDIKVEANFEEVGDFVGRVFKDQLPFATIRAINRTALDFQVAQREHMHGVFTIRRKSFAERSVKIPRGGFATKRRLQAEVRIESPGGGDRSRIFTKFEDQRSKTPFGGGSRIAVPTQNVPRTGTGVIQKRWRPKSLNLQPQKSGKVFRSKGDVFMGERRTFAVFRPGGKGMILRRTGSGEFGTFKGAEVLYTFWPRVRIEPELNFEANARRTVDRMWEANFSKAFKDAVRTARTKGPGVSRGIVALSGAVVR